LGLWQSSLYSPRLALEILGEDSRAGHICVSPDEARVHYVLLWLVEKWQNRKFHLHGQWLIDLSPLTFVRAPLASRQ